MALDPTTRFVGKIAAPSANYPNGEAQDISAPGDGTGTPFVADLVNDEFGLQQALLASAGIAPSNTPDTAIVSQYMQAHVELASGRAFTYDDSGVANAYVLDVQANQHAPASLFAGQVLKFLPSNTNNTAACTANPYAQGVKNIKLPGGTTNPAIGAIVAGTEVELIYRALPSPHLEIANPPPDTTGIAGAWVTFDGTAVTPVPIDSYNVTSITDNGVGNYTVVFTAALPGGNPCGVYGATGSIAAPIVVNTVNGAGVGVDQIYVIRTDTSILIDVNVVCASYFAA